MNLKSKLGNIFTFIYKITSRDFPWKVVAATFPQPCLPFLPYPLAHSSAHLSVLALICPYIRLRRRNRALLPLRVSSLTPAAAALGRAAVASAGALLLQE